MLKRLTIISLVIAIPLGLFQLSGYLIPLASNSPQVASSVTRSMREIIRDRCLREVTRSDLSPGDPANPVAYGRAMEGAYCYAYTYVPEGSNELEMEVKPYFRFAISTISDAVCIYDRKEDKVYSVLSRSKERGCDLFTSCAELETQPDGGFSTKTPLLNRPVLYRNGISYTSCPLTQQPYPSGVDY